jgi:hypothetical protein
MLFKNLYMITFLPPRFTTSQISIMNTLTTDLVPSVNEIITDMNKSSDMLTPPKRLFHVPTMSTVMYEDVADDVKEKGYVTISHVWGKRQMYSADELGIKNGVNWEIPLSDINKFHRIVYTMKYLERKYVWLDVICMPQDKQDEIDQEVPLMGDYYTGAEATFVLSDAEYDISDDFVRWRDMMEDVIEKVRDFTEEEANWMYSHDDVDLLDVSEEIWFTRVWTIQEAALSKKIILVDNRGLPIPLCDVLVKVLYMVNTNLFYIYHIFKKSWKHLLALCDIMRIHREGNFSIVNAWNDRDCYRPQDRLYGMLGLLGYKDFPVNYDISVEDLNTKIVQHASSKGDVTWISIGGNTNMGFIQPIHKEHGRVGNKWTEDEPGSCGIIFDDDVLSLNVLSFGTVIRHEKFANHSDDRKDFLGWTTRTFGNWGCSEDDVIRAIMGFIDGSDGIYGPAKLYIDNLVNDLDDKSAMLSELVRLFGDKASERLIDITKNVAETDGRHDEQTIAVVRLNETDKDIPLIIWGNVVIGDEIKLLRMHDELNRSLGIACNLDGRKGVFLYERVDIDKHLYTPCEFRI